VYRHQTASHGVYNSHEPAVQLLKVSLNSDDVGNRPREGERGHGAAAEVASGPTSA